jgi:tRNA A-37 threonylcarbamoyl transferase component Bud32
MDTDRNLLFGVLALQADLIDEAQFARACSEWAGRKQAPLAELLVERGWLTPSDRADVEKLLERKLRKHQGNARAGLAEVAGDPVMRSLADLTDTDIRQSLAGLVTVQDGPGQAATTPYHPEARDRYALSRLHATGGIGRVWLARDHSLGRDVALKELRPDRSGHPAVAARFLKEAQVTGQLEHPGVVPIYELGRRPDDQQPFYTMRFVRGRTLAKAVAAYHRRRSAGEAGPLELRELLGAFVGVCNAVAYAHSRGVLHRDLKPRNVVLGDFGEAIVLDWGLARLTGQPDDAAAPLELPAEGPAGGTVQGQVLGTPAYMAPEQAQGRLDLLSPATDVYGLGAILYEILTGRPPFPGGDTAAVLRQVVHEAPQPPRSSDNGVPAALEAVCLKALAKMSGERYATAKELAADVQRWLADEPVSAYAEPFGARLARRARRHRTVVAGVGAAAAVGVVALALAAAWLAATNRKLEAANAAETAAKQEAQEQEARARENFRLARESVNRYLKRVSDSRRLKDAGLAKLRKELLDEAGEFYRQFIRERADDPHPGGRAEPGLPPGGADRERVRRCDPRPGAVRGGAGLLPEAGGRPPRGANLSDGAGTLFGRAGRVVPVPQPHGRGGGPLRRGPAAAGAPGRGPPRRRRRAENARGRAQDPRGLAAGAGRLPGGRAVPGEGPRHLRAADGRPPGRRRVRLLPVGDVEQPRADSARPGGPAGGRGGPPVGPGGRGEVGGPLP